MLRAVRCSPGGLTMAQISRGDLSGRPPYSDYTGYVPVNTPSALIDPSRWQPVLTATGTPQVFVTPHWRQVAAFALAAADQYRPAPPAEYPVSSTSNRPRRSAASAPD